MRVRGGGEEGDPPGPTGPAIPAPAPSCVQAVVNSKFNPPDMAQGTGLHRAANPQNHGNSHSLL